MRIPNITQKQQVNTCNREASTCLCGRKVAPAPAGLTVDCTAAARTHFARSPRQWRDEVAAVSVSTRTFERYVEHVDRLIAGLGSILLSQLSPLALQSFYSDLRKNGHKRRQGGLSEQTLLHIHKVLKAALGQAVSWRLIAFNPAADVIPPKPARVETRTLNQDEIGCLLEVADGTPLYAVTLLCITTGLRRGELLGLKWCDLDRKTGRLSIVRSLEDSKAGLKFKAPKTARGVRQLPLPQVALDGLVQHERAQKAHRLRAGVEYQDHDLIFPGADGCPQRPRNVTKAFAALVAKTGMTKISLQGLRHTHITELLRVGIHPKVVSERAGHSSVAFTLQRYAHALPDMQQDAADQMQKLVGKLVSK